MLLMVEHLQKCSEIVVAVNWQLLFPDGWQKLFPNEWFSCLPNSDDELSMLSEVVGAVISAI